MTNTPGSNLIILDSDALIGLMNTTDKHHEICKEIILYLINNNYETFIPYPIVLEASTTLARGSRINRPDLAAKLLEDNIETESDTKINYSVSAEVAQLYNPKTSKKNTPFDHYVLALAKKNNIKYIFSFDKFYEKNGLTLIEDLL